MQLKIENIHKFFGSGDNRTEVLKGISCTVDSGSICVLLGPSGSGKSTLLNIIGGIETADEGTIYIGDEKIENMSEKKLSLYRRKHLGYVFQAYNLVPDLTVKENIRFSLPDSQKKNDELIKEYLSLVGLSNFENAYPKQLSGGMSQRVAIARALANKPKILLLDEPFGALDAITKVNLQEELLKIWKKENITMIIVTHDIDEAVYLGQKVVVMTPRPGRIKDIHTVNLGTVRVRTGELFTAARDEIYKEFFKESELPFSYSI